MKLKNDFYRIVKTSHTEKGADYEVTFNCEHFIYRAHFPQNPITPGACIIQMVKELSAEILNLNILLVKIDNVKFLHVIDPLKDNEVTFSISLDNDNSKIKAVVFKEEKLFAKLSLSFASENTTLIL